MEHHLTIIRALSSPNHTSPTSPYSWKFLFSTKYASFQLNKKSSSKLVIQIAWPSVKVTLSSNANSWFSSISYNILAIPSIQCKTTWLNTNFNTTLPAPSVCYVVAPKRVSLHIPCIKCLYFELMLHFSTFYSQCNCLTDTRRQRVLSNKRKHNEGVTIFWSDAMSFRNTPTFRTCSLPL